jgi:hypothetical protein
MIQIIKRIIDQIIKVQTIKMKVGDEREEEVAKEEVEGKEGEDKVDEMLEEE